MAEEKKRPSVAEMLAMARKADATKSAESSAAPAAPVAETPATPAAKAAPSAKPAAGGARPSVAEMLAMARAKKSEDSAPAAPTPAAEKPVAKAAPKPAAEKPAVPAAKPVATVKDTASVLSAARAGAKPGPTTKAEAESKENPKDVATAKAKLAVPPPVMPAKPEYAKPKAKAAVTDEITRTGFIAMLTGSFFAVGMTCQAVVGGLATLGLARYLFPNILTEPPSKFKIGFKDAYGNDKVDTRFTSQFGVWVVNSEYNGARQIFALKTVCTHLGCTPNWLEAEQKFKCPCHGSGFYKDGINFEGPAPRPLERYAIRISDDGQLEIDKSKTFQEEMGQWADPSCFVQV